MIPAKMIRRHIDGLVAWVETRQKNGFLEALNGWFQAANRKAQRYTRLTTARMVIFRLTGKLDFRATKPACACLTRLQFSRALFYHSLANYVHVSSFLLLHPR